MKIAQDNSYKIYFGNKSKSINPYAQIDYEVLESIRKELNLQNLFFINQVHSCNGICIEILDSKENTAFINQDGDYIITNLKNIGVGIFSADCLPILIYEPQNKSIASVHAGWKGSVKKIVQNTILELKKKFDINLSEIQVHFGPCAKVCCYEVKQDFIQNLDCNATKFLEKRNNKTFFNLMEFNFQQICDLGITQSQINLENNLCTICNLNFCSARRDKSDFRNISIISL